MEGETLIQYESEPEPIPEQTAELQAEFIAWKAARDRQKAVIEAAQKVADTFREMTPLLQTKTIFDLTQACRALAALLPQNSANRETPNAQ